MRDGWQVDLSSYLPPRIQPRNISGHGFAVFLVFRFKPLLQAWLFHPEHVYITNDKESQCEKQDRGRAQIQAKTDEQCHPGDVYGVAHVFVRTKYNEFCWRVKRKRRASSLHNKCSKAKE